MTKKSVSSLILSAMLIILVIEPGLRAQSNKININTASNEQLQTLPRIGAKRYETLKDLVAIVPEEIEKPEAVSIPEE